MEKKIKWLIPTVNNKYFIYDNVNVNGIDCIKVEKDKRTYSLKECLEICQEMNWFMVTI